MKNFFYLCEHSEIRASAYEYLLSLCDSASYLYGYRTDDRFDFEFEAIGTDCESLISAIINKSTTQGWGMDGAEYTFAMTDRVKSVITKYGLEGMIPVNNKYLENLTMYNEDKLLYSVCSHEGYTDFDDEFKNKVSEFCLEKAAELPIYKELNSKFSNYASWDIKELRKSYIILRDISDYVDQACKAVIYASPMYQVNYKEYVCLAEKLLSDDCVKILKKYKNFDELHPAGCPKTFAEIEKFINVPRFFNSQIYIKIKEQLDILEVVWYNHGIDVFSETVEFNPTIVIRDK